MVPMWNNTQQIKENESCGEQGFTMIEAVVAIFILTIGLIGTAAAVTFALEFSSISRNVTNGKLIVVSSIEEIESLRNSKRLEFKQIANVADVDNTNVANAFAGFSDGFKAVAIDPGADGVNGTDDDLVGNPPVREGYWRRITISNLPGNVALKKVEVSVQYPAAGGKFGEITGVGYLNDEFRITR